MKTAVVDNKMRVRIPRLKPGQVLTYEKDVQGVVTLKPVKIVEPIGDRPAKVRFEKSGRFTVAVSDRPINEEVIKELLADFP